MNGYVLLSCFKAVAVSPSGSSEVIVKPSVRLGEEETQIENEYSSSAEQIEEAPPPKKRCLSVSPVATAIPDPFPIPTNYPPRIQQAFDSDTIYGADRLALIRHICDIMVGYNPFPTPSEYDRVAHALVERYQCLADTIKGQPAWVRFKLVSMSRLMAFIM